MDCAHVCPHAQILAEPLEQDPKAVLKILGEDELVAVSLCLLPIKGQGGAQGKGVVEPKYLGGFASKFAVC